MRLLAFLFLFCTSVVFVTKAQVNPKALLTNEAMDEDDFWKIIDRSRRGTDGDATALRNNLLKNLRKEELKDIVRFNNTFQVNMIAANNTKILAAFEMLRGQCNDECALQARAWLVCQGKKYLTSAIANADEMYNSKITPTSPLGDLASVAADAFYAEMNSSIPFTLKLPQGVQGKAIDKSGDNLKNLFPQIYSVVNSNK
jgi:hypothetical protein